MLQIVSTAERPDLVATTARWRWAAFFQDVMSLEEMIAMEAEAANDELLPTVLVLLEDEEPVGMVALCLDDLDGRPDVNPWLAGLYVADAHRGKGYARRLITALESLAARAGIKRLSLYTASAIELYRKAGWSGVESFSKDSDTYWIMQKSL
ncbi:Acetyltransferase (GNAT) family protein [Rhizobium sp. RU20A]|uniref:GNAT family N-acetyltransferase n=1 Tax=Rhizobium sp. RU20A TaxID=1907412 RepID=UPI0009560220|nr:GNAT family N-acetyltransferase [Rhizobium sp. RU20A]SIQ10984.1 Acetyltransferase (GNAT) family protein [Rhizobium sp. RU20A]